MVNKMAEFHRVFCVIRAVAWDSAVTGVFLAWCFCMLLSNAPFSTLTQDIFVPVTFSLASAVIMLGVVLLSNFFPCRLIEKPDGFYRLFSYFCAALVSVAWGVFIRMELCPVIFFIAMSALSACSMVAFFYSSLIRFRNISLLQTVTGIWMTFFLATVEFLALSVFFEGSGLLFGCALLLVCCAAIVLRDREEGRGVFFEGLEIEKLPVIDFSRDFQIGISGIVRRRFFCGAAFLVGVLLSYELNGTQKTLHFAGILVDCTCVGGTALASVCFLVLTAVLMFAAMVVVLKPNPVLPGVIFVVLSATAFLLLPSYAVLPFPIMSSIALIALLALCLAFSAVSKQIPFRSMVQLTRSILTYFSVGLCMGAVLALLVLSEENLELQGLFFTIFQSVLLLSIIIFFIVSHSDIASLLSLGEDGVAKAVDEAKRPATDVDGRCRFLAKQCGLTPRETEILIHLSHGRNVPSIAETLVISKSTVKTHVLQIYRKANVSSRQALLDLIYSENSD